MIFTINGLRGFFNHGNPENPINRGSEFYPETTQIRQMWRKSSCFSEWEYLLIYRYKIKYLTMRAAQLTVYSNDIIQDFIQQDMLSKGSKVLIHKGVF